MEKGIPKMAVYFPQIQKAHCESKLQKKVCKPLFFFKANWWRKITALNSDLFFYPKIRIHSNWSGIKSSVRLYVYWILFFGTCLFNSKHCQHIHFWKAWTAFLRISYTINVFLFSAFGFRALLIGHVLQCMHLFFIQ